MSTALKLVTAPTIQPVTLAEARMQLKDPPAVEDFLIESAIRAACEHAEAYTGRRFVTQTWDYFLDCFPNEWANQYGRSRGEFALPHPPLVSVTSVKYFDEAGVEQTLATSEYQVDASSDPGRIAPAYGKSWPSARAQLNAVTVRFVCGYGGLASVPFSIKAAILLIVGHLFEHREENQDFQVHEMPLGSERLLFPLRVMRF